MRLGEISGYLRSKKINPEKMSAERKLCRFLEELSEEPLNTKECAYFYGHLLGASAAIAHLIPSKIRSPEKMLENLIRAYSKRGYCIFLSKEPTRSAFARLISESKKTKRGLKAIEAGMNQENPDLRATMMLGMENSPELVERYAKQIRGELESEDVQRKSAAIRALTGSEKCAQKNFDAIIEGLNSYGTVPKASINAIKMLAKTRNSERYRKMLARATIPEYYRQEIREIFEKERAPAAKKGGSAVENADSELTGRYEVFRRRTLEKLAKNPKEAGEKFDSVMRALKASDLPSERSAALRALGAAPEKMLDLAKGGRFINEMEIKEIASIVNGMEDTKRKKGYRRKSRGALKEFKRIVAKKL